LKESLDFLLSKPTRGTRRESDPPFAPYPENAECMLQGGKGCRHVIRWELPSAVVSAKLRSCSILLLLAVNLALLAGSRWGSANTAALIATAAVLLLVFVIEKRENRKLRKSLESTRECVEKMAETAAESCNTSLLIAEIGKALGTQGGTEETLVQVILTLRRRLEFDRGMILLADAEKTRLELHASFGYSERDLELADSARFRLDETESRGLFAASFLKRKPYLLEDLESERAPLPPWSLAFPKKTGSRALICAPILRDGEAIGILSVDNVTTKRLPSAADLALLEGIAALIGIGLRNAELVEARLRQFNSIIRVLAASIDARDTLTSGHSEKVTEYALGICHELGLPRDYREMIRVASLLHDYGKIGIPDAILKKDGRLTDEEYDIVKTHSARTAEILSRIDFEGIYCEVPRIAAAHHEKIDGTGYPLGLTGEEIPLGAKIIAVADYFEAVTARRHYRGPMPVEMAFALLRKGSGTHFDPRVVDAFTSYYGAHHPVMKTKPGEERRARRITCRRPVVFRVDGRTSSAITEDVSWKGVYVATEREVGEGQPIEISIPLGANHDDIVEAKGRVAWINGCGEMKKPAFPAGFGVEFLDFGETDKELFDAFIHSTAAPDNEPVAVPPSGRPAYLRAVSPS
jgi:HD-GYP domain-containing protein (c-di-GMP phosphodiesterase class II)